LKTLLPWTGDIWKFFYHILLNYREYFEFDFFYNVNFRGIAVIKLKDYFNIPSVEIDVINKYDYKTDVGNYLKILQNN